VPEEYEAYITEIAEVCKAMVKDGFPHPTVFEIETALAYLNFYRRGCDVAIMEAGMGGAGDATNVTSHPLCCVITSIGMDHMQFLGNSIEDIARNKAGILKEGCPAVSIWQEERVERVLTKEAADRKAPLVFCQPFDPSYPAAEDLRMLGSWQSDNSALAVETAHCLRNQGLALSEEVIRRGIQKAFWPGRMEQVVWEDPAKGDLSFYLDGAHNIPAARRLAETLEQYFTNASITYIIGVLADKEYDGMLDIMLPKADRVITLTPNNARALSGKILQDRIRAKGYEALFAGSVSEAVELAAAQKTDRILAFGSLSYLGELKSCLTRKK
jgi:dihydrofolate synthase/folylpolyglutamate synthase